MTKLFLYYKLRKKEPASTLIYHSPSSFTVLNIVRYSDIALYFEKASE